MPPISLHNHPKNVGACSKATLKGVGSGPLLMDKLRKLTILILHQVCPYLLKVERHVLVLLAAHILLQLTAKRAH